MEELLSVIKLYQSTGTFYTFALPLERCPVCEVPTQMHETTLKRCPRITDKSLLNKYLCYLQDLKSLMQRLRS